MKYYLIKGKCYESKEEIPNKSSYATFSNFYYEDMMYWERHLVEVDINEDELEVVKNKVYNFDNCAHDAPPIDITDIVEKKEIRELYNKYQNQSPGTIGFVADYIFKDYLFYKHTVSKETLDELFEAHDPEDFIDEDYVDEDFENRGGNSLEVNKDEELLIELEEWDHTCNDGCCHTYGVNIYINGEQIEDEDGTSSHQLLTAVLTKLGYTNVKVENK
jgi:hypothetical protein